MKLAVVDASGAQQREIEADDAVFGIDPNLGVVHQALLAVRANKRQGTHATRKRSTLRASKAKTRRQKGTGRARQGAASSHVRRGGAVAHGPQPRSYRQALPKRMRRLAIRSLLSQRAAEGGLLVLDDAVAFPAKTAGVREILRALGVDRRGLVVTPSADPDLMLGIRNLPETNCLPADILNVEALIQHDYIVMTEAAVRRAESLWGGERARLRRGAPAVGAGGGRANA